MGKLFSSPFAIKGELHDVCLFNFSFDPTELEGRIPAPLQLVIHRGRAWLSIVSVQLCHMRPALWPFQRGVNYHHLAHRILVDCPSAGGRQRGIYFLESYCKSPLLAKMGNLMTDYAMKPAAFRASQQGKRCSLKVSSGMHRLDACWQTDPGGLTPGSCLKDIDDGLSLVGPLTQALSVDQRGRVKAVRISRDSWPLEPVQALDCKTNRFNSAVFEFVARVPSVIPYVWNKAVVL